MKKRLLLSFVAVVMAVVAFAQHAEGDYVYTSNARYKLTGSNLLDASASIFESEDAWSPIAGAADFADFAEITTEAGPQGENVLQFTMALAANGVFASAPISQGTYVVTFKAMNPANAVATSAGVGASNRIALIANTTGDDSIIPYEGADGVASQASTDGLLIGTDWADYAIVLKSDSAWNNYLTVVFAGLAEGTMISNVEIWSATQVYDIRNLEKTFAFANQITEEEAFAENADALDAYNAVSLAIQTIMEASPEAFDDEATGIEAASQLNQALETFMEASAPSMGEQFNIGQNLTDFKFADYVTKDKSGNNTGYGRSSLPQGNNQYVQSGNWGTIYGEDFITSRIQNGYEHHASYSVYHPEMGAGKYFFTAEVRNAKTVGNNAWPCVLDWTLATDCKIFINDEVADFALPMGSDWTKVYLVADVPEGQTFHAGLFWPGVNNDSEFTGLGEDGKTVNSTAGTGKGGAFEVRNVSVRAFDGQAIKDDIARKGHFYPMLDQWNAAISNKAKVEALIADKTTNPYRQDSLANSLTQWDPYLQKVIDANWLTQEDVDGKIVYGDNKVATDEELDDWVKLQGVYTKEDTVGVNKNICEYALVRGYQNAINYATAPLAAYQTLASTIGKSNEVLNDAMNANGDKETFTAAINKAQGIYDDTYANASDATMETDTATVNAANVELLAAIEAFKESAVLKPFVNIDFESGYKILDAVGGNQITTDDVIDGEGNNVMPDAVIVIPGVDNAGEIVLPYINFADQADNTYNWPTKNEIFLSKTPAINDGHLLALWSNNADIDLSNAGVTYDDVLRISFSIQQPVLNGTTVEMALLDAAEARIAGYGIGSWDAYAFNDFGSPVNLAPSRSQKASYSKLELKDCYAIMASSRIDHDWIIDFKAQTVQCTTTRYWGNTTYGGIYDGGNSVAGPVVDFANSTELPAIFRMKYKNSNSGRRSSVDDIKMYKYKSQATGVEDVTEAAAAQAVVAQKFIENGAVIIKTAKGNFNLAGQQK